MSRSAGSLRPGVIESILRDTGPGVLAELTRRTGQFDLSEDAVQEALLAAATQWPRDGLPDSPYRWLLTVAGRRLTDLIRADAARRHREDTLELSLTTPGADQERPLDHDTSLELLILCCHQSLSEPSQIALTLRSVAGLTTAQIAHAFLVSESTMAQRISRAKKTLADAGARFSMPSASELPDRLAAVLHTVYLVYNEGHTASSGEHLLHVDLCAEAVRLTRKLQRARPEDGEVAGLLALMLFGDARRPARIDTAGALVPLEEQDRALWNQDLIGEGVALLTSALTAAPVGPYQLQAAIAAVHCEAADTASTDWPEILGLYAFLEELSPGPVVAMNRAVAVARVYGPRAGLRVLEELDGDRSLTAQHRLLAVRAHLLEELGDTEQAHSAYLGASRRTTSMPERRYLEQRAAGLSSVIRTANSRSVGPAPATTPPGGSPPS